MLPIHSFQYLQLSKDYEQNMGDTKQLEIIIQQLFYQKPKEKKKYKNPKAINSATLPINTNKYSSTKNSKINPLTSNSSSPIESSNQPINHPPIDRNSSKAARI